MNFCIFCIKIVKSPILKHMPGHQNAHPCAQTGAQAPKINFNNEILKRLKKKERKKERRRRKKMKTGI